MTGTYEQFKVALGHNESWNQYDYLNAVGYAGYYQFGEEALTALGYYQPDGTGQIDWAGPFTGKDAIHSVQEFLASPTAQEHAFDSWVHFLQTDILQPLGLNSYIGQTVQGVTVTESGLIAGAHLVGGWAMKEWLQGGSDGADVFGTPVSQYVRDYGGYSLTPDGASSPSPTHSESNTPVTPPIDASPAQGSPDGGSATTPTIPAETHVDQTPPTQIEAGTEAGAPATGSFSPTPTAPSESFDFSNLPPATSTGGASNNDPGPVSATPEPAQHGNGHGHGGGRHHADIHIADTDFQPTDHGCHGNGGWQHQDHHWAV